MRSDKNDKIDNGLIRKYLVSSELTVVDCLSLSSTQNLDNDLFISKKLHFMDWYSPAGPGAPLLCIEHLPCYL